MPASSRCCTRQAGAEVLHREKRPSCGEDEAGSPSDGLTVTTRVDSDRGRIEISRRGHQEVFSLHERCKHLLDLGLRLSDKLGLDLLASAGLDLNLAINSSAAKPVKGCQGCLAMN